MLFHLVGTGMELFKTSIGSWIYPEHSVFHIGHVPIFSGFMYASIGSYITRVTRIFDMRYTEHPSQRACLALAVVIYINFFTNHYLPDARGIISLLVGKTFSGTTVYYRPYQAIREMPLLFGFA